MRKKDPLVTKHIHRWHYVGLSMANALCIRQCADCGLFQATTSAEIIREDPPKSMVALADVFWVPVTTFVSLGGESGVRKAIQTDDILPVIPRRDKYESAI